MAFIKEESEDIRIAEVFSIKHEDTEEQTGWFLSQAELSHLILIHSTALQKWIIFMKNVIWFPNYGFYLTWSVGQGRF